MDVRRNLDMHATTTMESAAETHNRLGCPYLGQTIHDAVLDWRRVLADIDISALSRDLQAELQQLRQANLNSPSA